MKVVSFGEIMLRLSPDGYYKLFQKPELNTSFCGAEANVAVALSNFGDEAEFVTALPDNDIGRAACRELMRYGVKTDNIVYTGDRLGIFFAEKGASQRPSKVIYDRKNSAIALADPSSFDWEKIFDGADWFHITGITPALSDSLAKISVDAVKAAKKARHLVISGVVAECCVLSTVLSAIDAGCKVIYLTDAVAGLSEVSRKETENIISYFAPLHTVLMTTEEYLLSDTPKSHLCYKVSGH